MKQLPVKSKKIIGICLIVFILIVTALACVLIAKPLFECAGDSEKLLQFGESFREKVEAHGVLSRLVFVFLVVVQVVIAIIPGEPFEFAAGYAFGWFEGALLCMAGILIGSIIIFVLVRKFGKPFVNLFFPDKDLDNLKFLQNGERVGIVTFLLMFIPGTPKDLLSYAAGLTKMSMKTWLLIVGIARIPSVITSTIPGSAANENKFLLAVIIYGATFLVSFAGLLIYKQFLRKKNQSEEKTPAKETI